MDHGAITQNGEVEAVAVERHELRDELCDLFTECANQLLLGPFADVRRAQRIHRPTIALAVSDERANAHDRVVDVLRKFVTEDLTNVRIPLADEIVGSRKPG